MNKTYIKFNSLQKSNLFLYFMKYIDEYRDSAIVKNLVRKINEITTQSWQIMEICGGQTHTIMKYSLEELLPSNIKLLHGPGCPVCVTPIEKIDKAIYLAEQGAIITSFGDMMRVPGSKNDLLSTKAAGADIRMVYSPLDSLKIAIENSEKEIVFFAVGFETTAPSVAATIIEAKKRNLKNFSILVSHVLVPPAIEILLNSKQIKINAFLAAGHVCSVMGFHEYIPISEKYKIPIVVTGFEPADILSGIYFSVKQLEEKKHFVENQYSRIVTQNGNLQAQKLLKEVFETVDRQWRGIGIIPKSGFKLKNEFKEFDAEEKFKNIFDKLNNETKEINEIDKICIAGQILQGFKIPEECPSFKIQCTPEHPLGAPMVSSEGACAAYFNYSKNKK
jgi:hydrogenase expression/formation protein HypD